MSSHGLVPQPEPRCSLPPPQAGPERRFPYKSSLIASHRGVAQRSGERRGGPLRDPVSGLLPCPWCQTPLQVWSVVFLVSSLMTELGSECRSHGGRTCRHQVVQSSCYLMPHVLLSVLEKKSHSFVSASEGS